MCLLELWLSQGICPVVGLLVHMVVLPTDTKEAQAHLVKNLPAVEKTLIQFLGREDPLEKG